MKYPGRAVWVVLSIYMFLCAGISGQAQNKKNKGKETEKQYKSLLWEITGNGLKKPSYLYGTMHVSRKLAFHLADSFFVCLRNADAVALETSPEVWLDGMEKDRSLYQYASEENYTLYEKEFYQHAFEFKIPNKNKLEELLNTDLDIMNFLLYRTNYSSNNYEEDTYLDFFIYQSGKRLGKEVYSLEDFHVSNELSKMASRPSRDKKKKEKYTYVNNFMDKFEDAYRRGDLNMLDSLHHISHTNENYFKYLIDERNVIMANTMDSIMKIRSVFSGVGAAHLPGENGMIELLRKRGYKARPVKFNDIKESEGKSEIEKMKYPVTFSLQFAVDSSFRVKTPNKLYQMQATNDQYLYVSPDLANGCFYMIKRTPHYGQLTQESSSYLLSRIDSLIYENIPGKILERKNIEIAPGLKGIEVTNRTRRGDIHKCRIIVTPTEIVQLLVHGNQEYIQETDQDEIFLNSFEYVSVRDFAPKLFISPNKGFSVSVPGSALFNHETPRGYSSFSENLSATDAGSGNVYIVKKRILMDYNYIESDTFELNILSEDIVASARYKLTSRKTGKWQGYPSVDFSAKSKNKNAWIHGRIVIRGAEYYLVAHYGKNKNPDAAFFKSFSLNPYQYSVTYKTFEDKELFYKIRCIDDPTSEKNGLLYQGFNHIFEDNNYEAFKASVMEKAIVCGQTGEQVNITFIKFHKYYYKAAADTFWKHRIKMISEDRGMCVRDQKIEKSGNIWITTATVGDTGSIRIIKTKMFLKEGALYTLAWVTDSLTPESPFIKEVVNSFQPGDTVFQNKIFEDKLSILLRDIYSEDSATASNAKRSIDYCNSYFEEKDAVKLASAIKHPSFISFNNDEKSNLIYCATKIKDTILLAPLRKIYLANDDSSAVQFAILNTLAYQKTKASFKLIGELLNVDAPIGNDKYIAGKLFRLLGDSLPLCLEIYDDLLSLSGIPEYETYVTHLLAKINSNNLMTQEAYAKVKRLLLNKTNLEIKRQRAKAAKKSSYYSYSSNSYRSDVFNYLQNKKGSSNKDFNIEVGNDLYDYLSILVRSYQEPEVKAIFNKTLEINSEFLQLSLNALLLKNSLPSNDTIWEHYAKKDNTRLLVYAELKQADKLSKLNAKYLTQEKFCRAVTYAEKSNFTDSVFYFNKYIIRFEGKQGYVYAFKRKDKDGDIKADVIAMQHIDGKTIYDKDLYFQTSTDIDHSKNEKEELEKKISNILYQYRTQKRLRAAENSYEYSNAEDEEEYYEY